MIWAFILQLQEDIYNIRNKHFNLEQQQYLPHQLEDNIVNQALLSLHEESSKNYFYSPWTLVVVFRSFSVNTEKCSGIKEKKSPLKEFYTDLVLFCFSILLNLKFLLHKKISEQAELFLKNIQHSFSMVN